MKVNLVFFAHLATGKNKKDRLRDLFVQVTKTKKTACAIFLCFGARKKTRTSTMLPSLGPEPSASTNSAIRAI
jgi:hypothetical protein